MLTTIYTIIAIIFGIWLYAVLIKYLFFADGPPKTWNGLNTAFIIILLPIVICIGMLWPIVLPFVLIGRVVHMIIRHYVIRNAFKQNK